MDDVERFTETLMGALAPAPPMRAVQITTPEGGAEFLLYGDAPGYADAGMLIIPPGLPLT